MSKSHFTKKELRYEYDHSPIGKIQAYISRFHNIEKMRAAFEKTDDFAKCETLKNEMETSVSKLTDDFSEVEKEFIAKRNEYNQAINGKLFDTLSEIADKMKQFEKNYAGNK